MFAWCLQLDTLMEQSVLIEKQDRPTGDLLAELFKEGGSDPSALPTHPCPPGKKDKTMRSELMPFQVRLFRLRCLGGTDQLSCSTETRPRLDDSNGTPRTAQDPRRSSSSTLGQEARCKGVHLPSTLERAALSLLSFSQGQAFYYNLATESSQRDKPVLKRGGILADEMGASLFPCDRCLFDLRRCSQDSERPCRRSLSS